MQLLVFLLNVRLKVTIQSVSVSAVYALSASVTFIAEVASKTVIIGYLAQSSIQYMMDFRVAYSPAYIADIRLCI
jgi:hypothetical protein